MSESIFSAIRDGQWDYEPEPVKESKFNSTVAMPGSSEKVETLAARISKGLPLWHSGDRLSYDESEDALK